MALHDYEQEDRLQNDREWRAKLDHLKAEIARLQKALLTCAAIPHMGQYTGSRVKAAIEESKPWSTGEPLGTEGKGG